MVFADVSGFTALSERLATRGKLGAEQMTDLLDAVFERLLGAALDLGADLLAFGGDALCLLFDGDEHSRRAAAVAAALQRSLRARTPAHAAVGRISLGMSIGAHTGLIHLFRAGDAPQQLFALGPSVSALLALEGAAERGEILVSDTLAAALEGGSVGPEDRGGHLLLLPPDATPPAAADLEPGPVDPDLIAPRLLAQLRSGAPAEHRPATIAFVKTEGTDSLVADEPPEVVRAVLHDFVCEMQRVAERYEVCILDPDVYPNAVKFLISAGVPTATPDDADRMLEAAREIVAIDTPLTLRAGVNGGRVFAGPVGARVRRAYTVMGDTVNLAARMMAHAPAGTVLATDTILDTARAEFGRTPLPPLRVKGKAEPIHASVVGSPRGPTDRGEQTPLVGREREWGQLLGAWTAAADGHGSVIELVGVPGIGKSRLVAELLGEAAGFTFVAEGGVYAATSPYRALIPPLLQLVGIDPAASEADQGRLLTEYVEQHSPASLPWLPLLSIAFGVDLPDTPETAELAPEFRRARLAEAFVELLGAVLPPRTLVLVEDSHWVDEASQQLITTLARAIPAMGWVLLLTRRPDAGGLVLPDDLAAEHIALEPLDASAAEELARLSTDQTPLPTQTVAALIERSAGNPLFLSALLRAANAGGDIDALPESMESLIAAGIDTLDPRDRQVLRQAAVLGRTFPEPLLRDLVGVEGLDPALGRLDRFLDRDGQVIRFRHALLRDTAYEGLPFRKRAELHGRAAEHLEEQFAHLADEESELLSLHFFFGRQFDKAFHYSRVAADRARSDLAPVEAAVFYRRALDAARAVRNVAVQDRAELEESLADVEERSGRYELARASLRRARRLKRDDAIDTARLLQKDAWIEQRLGRFSQSLALTARALTAIKDSHGPEAENLRAALSVARAANKQRQGRYDECIEILQRELERMTPETPAVTVARAHFLLHSALSDRNDAAGVFHAREAIRLYEDAGDFYGQSGVLNNLGVETYYEGDWATARDLYERSEDLARRIGDVVEAATVRNNIGEILADQGEIDDAEEAFRDALRVWRGAGYAIGIGQASLNLGRLAARKGQTLDAHELLDTAHERFAAIGARAYVLQTSGARVETLLVEHRAREALDQCDAALAAGRAADDRALFEAWLHRLAGAACTQLDEPVRAREHWDAALVAAETAMADFERALTLDAIAQTDPTSDAGTEASEVFSRLGVRQTMTATLLGNPDFEMPTSA